MADLLTVDVTGLTREQMEILGALLEAQMEASVPHLSWMQPLQVVYERREASLDNIVGRFDAELAAWATSHPQDDCECGCKPDAEPTNYAKQCVNVNVICAWCPDGAANTRIATEAGETVSHTICDFCLALVDFEIAKDTNA